ncbi:MAG TPA: amino acid permease, partial [Thermoanaerobaculia bacterium]
MSAPATAAPPVPARSTTEDGLERGLNLWDTTLLVLGLVLGGGIFLTPSAIARALPSPGWILVAWLTGGLLSIAGGLVYAELGAMMPEAGGMYLYIGRAFGPLPGFLYAWMAYFVILAGAGAAVAIGFAEYFSAFFPSLSTKNVLFGLGGFDVSAGQLVAVAAVLLLSATHYVGVREGSRIQGILTSLIVAALVALGVGGLFAKAASSSAPAAGPISLAAFGTAMVGVFWCYYGWNEIAAVAGEVRRPSRNLPLALIGGTTLVMLLYVGANVAFLRTMSVGELAQAGHPATVAATKLVGPGAAVAIALAVTVAAAGCLSASIVPAPRITYALARDGLFFPRFGRAHPRFHTPAFATIVQAIWMSLLCLSGRYDQLYTYATFAVILAYAATGIALLVFRRRLPDAPRPYRCWGYPVVPILFVLSSAALAVNTVREQPKETLAGLGILSLGV